MDDLAVEPALRERLEHLLGRRRDRWLAAGVVGGVALVALILLGRGSPASIAPPSQSPAQASYVPAGVGVSPFPPALVFVDVSGAVRAPGLYSLPLGARVADALEAAGGARARADVSLLNLAEVLVDSSKVDVPRKGVAGVAEAPAGSVDGAPSPGPAAPIPLNTADQAALETIPGIGPVTAGAILAFRDRMGGFGSIDQLLEIDGIGPATLEEIRPYVSL